MTRPKEQAEHGEVRTRAKRAEQVEAVVGALRPNLGNPSIWPRWGDAVLMASIAAFLKSGVHETTTSEMHGLAPSTVPVWLHRFRKRMEERFAEDAESVTASAPSAFEAAVMPVARAHAAFVADLQWRAASLYETVSGSLAADGAAQWLLARLKPSVYGSGVDKALEAAGPDAGKEAAALLAALASPRPE